MESTYRDVRHWEIRAGRWSFSRWCAGAPCLLTAEKRHPLAVVRIKRMAR